ncbi:MAG: histidine kinase, partial [Mucilaginibacter polytrichastri]|nr:histidine kinase [Mucilaginibacter polytrichastri]
MVPEQPEDALATIPGSNHLFIVGIGASAGGVEALTIFFENVKPDSGIAYVVILHLPPLYESQLDNILRATTTMPVMQVKETMRVEPNHVYVLSPNNHITMEDGTIRTTENIGMEERRAPVDIFFRTLAESHTNHAVAVILSGTGANGSMGIKRIKERGGAVFVQNPREAAFNEMPRNAIATDLIDDVMNVAEMPARIVSYRDHLGTVEIAEVPEERTEDQQHALREIFVQLRLRTGHDFTNYKRPTLLRRIERRINIRNLPNLVAYATYVRENPDETTALLKDLLISVTNFFRDKPAFEYLEKEILPRLVKGKQQGESLRIWVAGCATGEEAYSLAMLCAERTLGFIDAPKIQIFATDIDESAIAQAREGLYTINDAADVSPERLRRYFTKEGDEYRIRREIREMILFASHNVLKDPPFSHIDLVTCRNMLIYLNNTGQERVMETFHFALNPGSYLFLGNSESADGANDLYVAVNREFRIYQSRAAGLRPYPIPESVPNYRPEAVTTFEKLAEAKPATERISYGDLHQQL